MRLSVEDLRAFVKIADCGIFHQAATALCLTPSALSRRISKFEAIAGAQLFERTTHLIALTAFGQAIRSEAEALNDQFQAFENLLVQTSNHQAKEVSLACVATVAGSVLPRLIKGFQSSHKDTQFSIFDVRSEDVVEQVTQRNVQFAIDLGWSDGSGDLEYEPLVEESFVLGVAKNNKLADRTSLTWSEVVSSHSTILGIRSANRQILERALAEHGISVPWVHEVDHMSTQMGFADHGLAAALLPQIAVCYSTNADLCFIPITEPVITREIALVYRRTTPLSRTSRDFMEFIREHFANIYAEIINGEPQHE